MNQYNTIIIKTHILLNKNGFSLKVMKLEGEIASFHDNKSLTIPGPPGVPDYFPLTPVTPPYEVRFNSVLGWSAILINPKLVNVLKFLDPFAHIISILLSLIMWLSKGGMELYIANVSFGITCQLSTNHYSWYCDSRRQWPHHWGRRTEWPWPLLLFVFVIIIPR